MNKIFAAAAAFSFTVLLTACSLKDFTDTFTDSASEKTSVSETEIPAETSESVTSGANTDDSTPVTSEQHNDIAVTETAESDSESGDFDIPDVAWTEINLYKTMYALSSCTGYDLALSDGTPEMIYDPGYEFYVISRTSTGYYRVEGDYYIPCEFINDEPPADSDPDSAGCTEYTEASAE